MQDSHIPSGNDQMQVKDFLDTEVCSHINFCYNVGLRMLGRTWQKKKKNVYKLKTKTTYHRLDAVVWSSQFANSSTCLGFQLTCF